MTRQEEILKGLNESWGQNGINISSNTANSSNGITVNNPTGSGRAVELNFVDGINPTRLTAAQIALLPNPQAGQIVYQTDGVVGLYTYDGTSWVTVKSSTTVFGTTNRISVTGGDTIDIASTYVGQTSITTLGTVTTGTWGAVIGQATMTLGSDATGDIYYRNSGGKLTRLGIGSAGQVLGVSAGIPAWQAAGGGITVGTTTITSGTSGRVAFNNSGVYGESANLFWDNANNTLKLSSSSGTKPLIARVSTYSTNFTILGNDGTTSGAIGFYNDAGSQAKEMALMFRNAVDMVDESSGIRTFHITPSEMWWYSGGYVLRATNSWLKTSVKVGINTATDPTAYLHISAGTATAGTAPLKLTSGTNLTTPENGAFEFDGTNLYFTVGGVRKTVTLL